MKQGIIVGEESWKWIVAMKNLADRPICVSCGVSILDIPMAGMVHVKDSKGSLICKCCVDRAGTEVYSLPSPCTVEELKAVTKGEERARELDETLARQKAERARARKTGKNTKAGSRTRASKSSGRNRTKTSRSGNKKT